MRQWPDLIDRIVSYHPNADLGLLNQIHALLRVAPPPAPDPPDFERPLGGLPFDPIDIANILVELRLDVASISAGLLCESFHTKQITLEKVRELFGSDVAFILEGVSKISLLSSRARLEIQVEELRKMILAMAKDIRVILVRLAMCLQQVRAVMAHPEHRPPERMAREIMEIYAPIAHRLGIHWVMSEMEDGAFKLKDPALYEEVRKMVEGQRHGGEDVVRRVIVFLKKKLRKYDVIAEVSGREKHIYSVWGKTMRKGVGIDDLFDLIAYRVIVRKKSDCYRVLGMIHSEMKPIPGRFKDYIALPKSNGYQSLHSAVIGPFGNRIEIQIRTQKMHDIAERGVAAHWCYKDGRVQSKSQGATGYAWLQQLLEVHRNAEDVGQFLENVRIDLFPDEIYVFSPKGDIVTLPKGATPVDFAYAIHSEVGDRCQGSKINSRMAPLRTPLNTGDTVEILTGKSHTPSQNWLQFVVTSNAKYRITRWIRDQEREQSITLGRELLEREARKVGSGLVVNEKGLRKAAEEFKLDGADDVLFQIGSSRLSASHVLHRIFPEQMAHEDHAAANKAKVVPVKTGRDSGDMQLTGILPNMVVLAARCCNPVPGDPVVGIVTTGKGITIHVVGCPNLDSLAAHPERWIEDLAWRPVREQMHQIRLRSTVRGDEKGVIALMTKTLTEAKAVIVDLRLSDRNQDPCVVNMELEVFEQRHLREVMSRLRGLPSVINVERVQG